jgi:hypothetical protein
MEAARFAAAGEKGHSFSEDDVEEINKTFRERIFFNVFSQFALQSLKDGDDAAVQRYVDLLVLAGNRADSLNKCISGLSKQVNTELTTLAKDDPVHQSWGFRIGSLIIKKTVSGVFGKADGPAMEAEIQVLRQCRDSYPTPAEFTEVRRRFNTDLLGALQDGAMGSFDSAGDVLEGLLKDIPPGLSIGANEERLRALRDYCKNPAQAANSGVDLNAEFQKLYKLIRDQSSPGAKSSMISGQAVL